jgi:predicted ferric reductase
LLLVAALRIHSPNLLVYEIARSFGLAGFVILALQPVMVARIKWIERPFGTGALTAFHKSMGIFVTVLMVSHPILMEFGGGQFLAFTQPWYIWVGRTGLVLLLILTLMGVYWKKVGLTFNQWHQTHYVLAPLVIGLVFVHSLETGDDLKLASMQILWTILLVVACGAYIYRRFIVAARLRH